MKTTVEVPDALFRRAKKYCAEHSISFRVLIEDGLRRVLDSPAPARPFRLKPFGFRGEGMAAPLDWKEIREMIYEGRGGTGGPGDRD
jgi:hypothetical protein